MSNQWIGKFLIAAMLTGGLVPVSSFADKQDHDLADRVYEKFKERELAQRKEQESASKGQKNSLVRKRSDDSSSGDSRAESVSKDRQKNVVRERRDDNRGSQRRAKSSRSKVREDKRSEPQSQQNDNRYQREQSVPRETRSAPRSTSRSDRYSNSGSQPQRTSAPAVEQQVREAVSLDQAVNIVRRRTDGKVVGAKTVGSGTRRQHRIKVLINDSRVRTFVVSPITGEVY